MAHEEWIDLTDPRDRLAAVPWLRQYAPQLLEFWTESRRRFGPAKSAQVYVPDPDQRAALLAVLAAVRAKDGAQPSRATDPDGLITHA